MYLNQLLAIARQRGKRVEAITRQGNHVWVIEYAPQGPEMQIPRPDAATAHFHPANVLDKETNASFVAEIMLPFIAWTELKNIEMEHAVDVGVNTLKPHLPDMLEAFPELKIYAARSLELLDNNQAAVVASYDTYEHPDSSLNILKGFGAMGCLSYAEVEKWRYKEIPIPT